MFQSKESIGQNEKQTPQGERLVPTTVKRLSLPDVGDVNIVHLKGKNGKNKALVAVGTSFDHFLPYEPGAPETSSQKVRNLVKNSRLAQLAVLGGAIGFMVPTLQSNTAEAMEAENVPEFEDPQPASWSIPGDQNPNISEIDGRKVILFHSDSKFDDYAELQYIDCDRLEDCLTQNSTQRVEGVHEDAISVIMSAFVYENTDGQYILRYQEGSSVFERPVAFINGVLTATGDKTSVVGAPNSGALNDDNIPHIVGPAVGEGYRMRIVKNLHDGSTNQFQYRADNKGLTEANVCGTPHYCRYNAKAIGSRLRELHGGTQLCDLVVADSLEELMNSVHRLDTSTFPPAHKPKNPRLMDNVLIYTSEVAPGPGEATGSRIWYAVRIPKPVPECETDEDCEEGKSCDQVHGECMEIVGWCEEDEQCPPGEVCNTENNECETEIPTIDGEENIDIHNVVQPSYEFDYGTDEATAISTLQSQAGEITIRDSEGNEYPAQLAWNFTEGFGEEPGGYWAEATIILPADLETGELLVQWGENGEQTISTIVTVKHATIENTEPDEDIGNISVPHGTSEADVRALLPQTIEITNNAREVDTFGISWNLGSYNPEVPGPQTITGYYTLSDKYEPPREREVTVIVTVEEQENPDLPTLSEVLDDHIGDSEFGYGTSEAEVLNQLQTAYPTIEIVDIEGGRHTADLEWSLSGWDEAVQGTYPAIGTIKRRQNSQGKYEYEFGETGQREVLRNASNLPSEVEVLVPRNLGLPIRVDYGTPSTEILNRLPETVKLLDERMVEHYDPPVRITWDLSNYNPHLAGEDQIFLGTVNEEDIPYSVFGNNLPAPVEVRVIVREAESTDPCEFTDDVIDISNGDCKFTGCDELASTFNISGGCTFTADFGKSPLSLTINGAEIGINIIEKSLELNHGEITSIETNGNGDVAVLYKSYDFVPVGTKYRINALSGSGDIEIVEVEVMEGAVQIKYSGVLIDLLEAGESVTFENGDPVEEVDPTPSEEVGPTQPNEEVGPTPSEEVGPTPSEEVGPTQPIENGDGDAGFPSEGDDPTIPKGKNNNDCGGCSSVNGKEITGSKATPVSLALGVLALYLAKKKGEKPVFPKQIKLWLREKIGAISSKTNALLDGLDKEKNRYK